MGLQPTYQSQKRKTKIRSVVETTDPLTIACHMKTFIYNLFNISSFAASRNKNMKFLLQNSI